MVNLSSIRPAALIRMLNSTPLGQVLGERQLSRNLQQVGYRITGDREGKKINLFKFGAWQVDQLEAKIQGSLDTQGRTAYEGMKEAARARSAAASASGRDIGAPPPVVDPERREACRYNLKLFLETYFPKMFYLSWSDDHLNVIAKIEASALNGGLFALAMPRGQGKTTISECAGIWASVYGHRQFVVLIGSTEPAAQELLSTIKMEFETNELLYEDFPEVCYPIVSLDGINNRCNGQTSEGIRTRMTWTDKEIVFPTVKESKVGGTTIKTVGILGRVRGMKRRLPDGRSIRPDYVIIDDPQTDESASSPEQNRKRMRVISGAILGLSGPGKEIAGVMPCTVIRPGDMADQTLDRKTHPEWNGERLKLLIEFPTDMDLWAKYQDLWAESQRTTGTIAAATAFYKKNREKMDAGAKSSWPERFEPGELSGIQYAMNLFIKDQESFYSEYQNEPQPDDNENAEKLTVEQIFTKLNGRPRREAPIGSDRIVAFVDVQKKLMYYVVMAFKDDFTGWVIDYGTFPDQKRRYFTLRNATEEYPTLYPGAGLEGAIYAACRDTTSFLFGQTYRREDGVEMKLSKCLIDSGWGKSTDPIFQFCRESEHAAMLLPSKGEGKGPTDRPFSEYKRGQGDRIGFNWMIPNVRKKRTIRYVIYDTNFWKTFVRERLLTAQGDIGSMSIFGKGEEFHRQFAEHLTSEYSEPAVGRGRKVDVWSLLPGRSENHWWDGVVGCCVAASESGSEYKPGGIRELKKAAERSRPGGRVFTPGRMFRAN